jgi:putative membrane protein
MARGLRGLAAGTAAVALVVYAPVTTAVAQDGAPVITNTETVNVSLDPAGNVDVARVYDQIAIQGSGPVSYVNPVSTAGLRNLDGFGGFTVEEGAIVEETTVDGQLRRRTVSDFELDLPVSVTVEYKLDGEVIEPGDLVGKSGRVEVTYTIENQTGEPEEITVLGADNRALTETQTVYDPLAGSLSLTLPPNYTDVVSDSGFLTAGDGRGGTLMTFSVTLIGGLTDPVAVGSYTAKVENAVIPPASMSIVPVLVKENPSSAAQLEALQGGADTGRELASGAGQIDSNLLRLAKGAGDLVNGLILLRDGSAELSDGLVNTAAPGAQQLADGSGELAAGLNGTAVPGARKLADGSGELAAGLNGTAVPGARKLADGSGELAAGLNGTAVPGSQDLADGAAELAGGLLALNAGVPGLVDGVIQLDDGADQLEAGLKQLQSQIPALSSGVSALSDGADQLQAGLEQLQSQIPALTQGVDQLATGGQQLSGGLIQLEAALDAPSGFGAGLDKLATDLAGAAGSGGLADQVVGGITLIKGTADCGPICQGTADAVSNNVDTSVRNQVQQAADGAGALNQGYTTQIRPTIGQLSAGADNLAAGLEQLQSQLGPLAAGVDQLVAGAQALAAGLAQLEGAVGPLADGIDRLTDGATQLSDGLTLLTAAVDPLAEGVELLAAGGILVAGGADQLADGLVDAGDGATQVADGNAELADGLVDAGDGANQVADGNAELADGLVDAGDGANQVADGNAKLADGLQDAADGSVKIANGLEDAAESAPAIPAGAQRLSDEGTSQIAAAGADTLVTFGQRVALLKAGAERTADGGLPFGAPEGALVAAAYRYDLAGASGTGSQNVAQLAGFALIAGGAAAGATALARRRAV